MDIKKIEREAAALVILVRYGVEPDIQELLVNGDQGRGIRPGALRAAIDAALPAQEWQNISTAPKDTPVLGMNKHSDIGHTHWLEADEGAEACWWNDQDDDEWHPLWWMPCLPPMPDTLIAEERGT